MNRSKRIAAMHSMVWHWRLSSLPWPGRQYRVEGDFERFNRRYPDDQRAMSWLRYDLGGSQETLLICRQS